MNNWFKGTIAAIVFFIIMGAIGSLSENPVEYGSMMSNFILPVILFIIGCAAYSYYKHHKQHSQNINSNKKYSHIASNKAVLSSIASNPKASC